MRPIHVCVLIHSLDLCLCSVSLICVSVLASITARQTMLQIGSMQTNVDKRLNMMTETHNEEIDALKKILSRVVVDSAKALQDGLEATYDRGLK